MTNKRNYVADHARRTLRRAGVPRKLAAQLVANLVDPKVSKFSGSTVPESLRGADGAINLSKMSRGLCGASLIDVVARTFSWAHSHEGYCYWRKAIWELP